MKASFQAGSTVFELYCYEQGSGKPVVMLHGLVSTHRYMQEVYHRLPKETYHVIAPDLLGMGKSPRPRGRQHYVMPVYVESLAHTLEQKKLKPFVLVGHSMGAIIALEYANKYPERVERLVLSGVPMFEAGKVYEQFISEVTHSKMGRHRSRLVVYGHFLLNFVPKRVLPRLFSDYQQFVLEDALDHNIWSYLHSVWKAPHRASVLELLQNVRVPVHVIVADEDKISSLTQAEITALRKRAIDMTVVSGSHQIPFEHAELYAQLIQNPSY